METRYLERLKEAGVEPDEIDMVMCTHLHVDHVGWNTRLENGKWVPTFRNAKYVFSRADYDHYLKLDNDPQDRPGQRRLVPRFGAAGGRGGPDTDGRRRRPARREPAGRAGARPHAGHDRHQARIPRREGVCSAATSCTTPCRSIIRNGTASPAPTPDGARKSRREALEHCAGIGRAADALPFRRAVHLPHRSQGRAASCRASTAILSQTEGGSR